MDALSKQSDIIITEADKNLGVAIVNTTDYIEEGLKQLLNDNVYVRLETLQEENIKVIWNSLKNVLKQHHHLSPTGQHLTNNPKFFERTKFVLQLENNASLRTTGGIFYMLLKVHKKMNPTMKIPPGRPIVSSLNTITYFASKLVDKLVQPIYEKLNSYIRSSEHLIYLLSNTQFPPNCFILCADIESLYPNIPIDKGLLWFRTSLFYYQTLYPALALSPKDIEFIVALTKWVLSNNYFTFGDLQFRQIQGTAMGTPLAVVFACLAIDFLERKALFDTGVNVLFYRRFVDDICLICTTEEECMNFIEAFNNLHPTIKCTYTLSNKEGVLLDVYFWKDSSFVTTQLFSTKLYQKEQNKYLYIPPCSYHAKHVFRAFVQSEICRYRLLCSHDADFKLACYSFAKRLMERGYPSELLKPWFQEVFYTSRDSLLKNAGTHLVSNKKSQLSNELLVFKTLTTPELQALRISNCITLPDNIRQNNSLGQAPRTLVSYRNTRKIGSWFTPKRAKLHNMSIKDNVVDYHMNNG